MVYLSHILYDMPGSVPRMDVLFWGLHGFQIRLSNSDTSRNTWNRCWRIFMVNTGILSTIWSSLSHECKMTFCSLTEYNDLPPPIRHYTNTWSFWPNSTFYPIMKGFNKTFATDVACWQGTLTPPDTWSCLIWDLHMFYWLRPDLFPILFRTMLFEYTSVISQICLKYDFFRSSPFFLITYNHLMYHVYSCIIYLRDIRKYESIYGHIK